MVRGVRSFTIKVFLNVLLAFVVLEAIRSLVLATDNYFYRRIPWPSDAITGKYADQEIHSYTLILGYSVA